MPLAEFDLVQVEDDLIRFSAVPEIASLGAGIGFGSIHVSDAAEFNFSDIPRLNEELRADLLLFDYWVQNEDRILGEQGGNPNLLWRVNQKNMAVIDHNNAFDPDFKSPNLFRNHVFRASKSAWNLEYKQSRQQKLLEILEKLPDIVASVPEEWFVNDDVIKIPLQKEVERMECILRRIETEPSLFWEDCV